MSFRRWRDKTFQCKCSMRHWTASRRHCTCAIIHWTTSKQKCTWRNGIMNYFKNRIACWQDDDELLQNKDRKDGKVWLNQMIMNNRVGEVTYLGCCQTMSKLNERAVFWRYVSLSGTNSRVRGFRYNSGIKILRYVDIFRISEWKSIA